MSIRDSNWIEFMNSISLSIFRSSSSYEINWDKVISSLDPANSTNDKLKIINLLNLFFVHPVKFSHPIYESKLNELKAALYRRIHAEIIDFLSHVQEYQNTNDTNQLKKGYPDIYETVEALSDTPILFNALGQVLINGVTQASSKGVLYFFNKDILNFTNHFSSAWIIKSDHFLAELDNFINQNKTNDDIKSLDTFKVLVKLAIARKWMDENNFKYPEADEQIDKHLNSCLVELMWKALRKTRALS